MSEGNKLSSKDKSFLDELNKEITNFVSDRARLRRPFIQARFNYIKQYCEDVSGVVYTDANIAQIAHVLTSLNFHPPGDDDDPWANFEGRIKGMSEEDCINAIFFTSSRGLTPKGMYLQEFNAFLQAQRIPVKLATNGVQTYWLLSR